MFRALIEPGAIETARSRPEIVNACNVHVDWLGYAAELFSPAEIDLRLPTTRSDTDLPSEPGPMRVTFVTTPPNEGGTVPASAFTGRVPVDIIDQPVLEFLACGTKADGQRQGLELTQLRLKPSAVLADAYMLDMAHAALFHVAAVEHFASHDDLTEQKFHDHFPATSAAARGRRTSTPTRRLGCVPR